LIDSVLSGYDIGIIYLREVDGGEYDFEVLDGQQRLRSIDQFVDGEFKTDNTLNGGIGEIGYQDLEEDNDLYPEWIAFELQFQRIRSGSNRAVADFFLRLQEGMRLSTPEILNAVIGDMRDDVIELSEYPIFDKLGISDKRYRHRFLAAQAMKVEIDGDFENNSFPSMKKDALKRMYESYRNDVPSGPRSEVKRTLNKLDDIFGDATYIQNQGDFLPVYMLVRYLRSNFVINDKEDDIGDFVQQFMSNVQGASMDNQDADDYQKPYYEYLEARGRGTLSSQSFERRFSIILSKCLEVIPDILQKDEQRLFDQGQKLAIWYGSSGECGQCGESLSFGEAEFHHIDRYEDGGSTTVENGEAVHPDCHPR
jgi:hypothetical protein